MNDFNPKDKSKGLGDTIAKITHATGLDKVADAVAKVAGAEDCGCNKRRKTLNELFPYTKKTEIKKPHINTEPLLTFHEIMNQPCTPRSGRNQC